MYMCSRRDVIAVECLNGITGYAQVSVVLGPVGSGHATVEYGNSRWFIFVFIIENSRSKKQKS